ncbi:hypothetical protein WOLCODRAFT_140462 [Wolfiporia cocos MD-104 SS10]|uniref:Uncharacterized protein n=1 Tax=Wolfiporia cocos (strain MD-104) TaxID=742152 RepID=A0A2H3JFJ6_WOLCO|nr:hypothetical protein WOLCODRAFT_140462 [Wolfiporia cocos MD-104 SS10]
MILPVVVAVAASYTADPFVCMNNNQYYVSHLPPEIRGIIFSFLSDDRRALCSCSLTCRAWLEPTRVHLFRSIRLLGSWQYVRFERLIHNAPHLTSCVRELYIHLDGTFTWMDQEVTRILLKLDKVEHLTIRNWSATIMLDEVRVSLANCFPNVRTLVLQDVAFAGNDLPVFLCACPNLTSLHLLDVHWTHRGRALVRATPQHSIRITSLSLRRTTSLASHWLARGPFEVCPRELTIIWDDPVQTSDMRQILQRAGAHLEHLAIIFQLPQTFSEAHHDLSLNDLGLVQNTSLQTLRVAHDIDIRLPRNSNEKILDQLPDILAQLHTPTIHRIQIDLHMYDVSDLDSLNWEKIEQHFLRLVTTQPRLAVFFDVYNTEDGHAPTEEVVNEIVRKLPNFAIQEHRLCIRCSNTRNVEVLPTLPFGGTVTEE